MLGNLLGGFIVILIGVSLIGSIANNIWTANYGCVTSGCANISSVSPTSTTLLGLVTLFFALGVMSAGVGLAVSGLRNAGLI